MYTCIVMWTITLDLLLADQVRTLSQSFNYQLVALCSAIDILDVVGGGLKVAGGIIAFGDEDVVIDTTLEWLVEWDWWSLSTSALFPVRS